MQHDKFHPAIQPGSFTMRDLVATLALTAVGLMLTPVVGLFVLLVD
jgi:hypothetical protein